LPRSIIFIRLQPEARKFWALYVFKCSNDSTCIFITRRFSYLLKPTHYPLPNVSVCVEYTTTFSRNISNTAISEYYLWLGRHFQHRRS